MPPPASEPAERAPLPARTAGEGPAGEGRQRRGEGGRSPGKGLPSHSPAPSRHPEPCQPGHRPLQAPGDSRSHLPGPAGGEVKRDRCVWKGR